MSSAVGTFRLQIHCLMGYCLLSFFFAIIMCWHPPVLSDAFCSYRLPHVEEDQDINLCKWPTKISTVVSESLKKTLHITRFPHCFLSMHERLNTNLFNWKRAIQIQRTMHAESRVKNPMEYECKLHVGSAFEDFVFVASARRTDEIKGKTAGRSNIPVTQCPPATGRSNARTSAMSEHGAWSSWQSFPGQSALQTGHWLPPRVPGHGQRTTPLLTWPLHLTTTSHNISVSRYFGGLSFCISTTGKKKLKKIIIYILLPSTTGMICCDCFPQ